MFQYSNINQILEFSKIKMCVFNSKRRKNWIGTISGTLSHHSSTLFTSGFAEFNEAGWWKLTHNKTPKQYYDHGL